MTANSTLDYPAEYYYPEYLESRPDDPLKINPERLPTAASLDKGISPPKRAAPNLEHKNETTKKHSVQDVRKPIDDMAANVATDQGLPGTDITQAFHIDPKKNLLRDPAAKNMPRLIVNADVIKQAVGAPRILTTNLDNDLNHINNYSHVHSTKKTDNALPSQPYVTTNTSQLYNTMPQGAAAPNPNGYVESQPTIDDYWKKQVLIDNEGAVSIEPIKYDKNVYEGPFGLTRQGATIYYVIMSILTVLSAVFLIMTGVFYSQKYPDTTSDAGKLAGMGVCGFCFYLGIQMILIGIWHQKYRREHLLKKKQTEEHNNSSTHLKSAMETDPNLNRNSSSSEYRKHNYYSNPPYASNPNENLLLKQPGAATGFGVYEPVIWPSNIEVDTQSDSRFLHPMEWSYGVPQTNPKPVTPLNPIVPAVKDPRKGQKRFEKTVYPEPPKPTFNTLFPNSTVIEQPLPKLTNAPETNDLIRAIADQGRTLPTDASNDKSTLRKTNRAKPYDRRNEVSNRDGKPHYSRNRSQRHHRRRHRHDSISSCSTCSSRSSNRAYSDININRHNYQQQYSGTLSDISPAQTKTNFTTDRDINSKYVRTTPKNSYSRTNLENIPSARDHDAELVPAVHRTVIVDPHAYPRTSPTTPKTFKDTSRNLKTEYPTRQTDSYSRSIDTNKRRIDNKNTDLHLEDVNNSAEEN